MNSPVVKNGIFEGRVLIGFLAVLLSIEICLRLFEDQLSGNIEHIFQIPHIVSQMDQFEAGSSIVFMGNSLINNAIDSEFLESTLRDKYPGPIHTLKITPDGTAISDWFCTYQNSFTDLKHSPSHIVLGFAWGLLSDQYPNNPTRLGGFFCDSDNLADLSVTGLTQHQKLFRFFAGTFSHVYVNRERIRNRILNMFIPNYQDVTQMLNQSEASRTPNSSAKDNLAYTYLLLERLVALMQSRGTNLILVAMPVMEPYELDADLLRLSKEMHVPLLDLRSVEKIDNSLYKDAIHLNEQGKRIFSKQIMDSIEPYLNKTMTSKNLSTSN